MYTKYNKRAPSKVTVINADWRTVPWEECEKIYQEAAVLAEETALAVHTSKYKEYLERANMEGFEPKPISALPNRLAIRRKAGQKAVLADFIPKYKLEDFAIHYMPQIVAHIATLSLVLGSGEIMLGKEYYDEHIKNGRAVNFTRDDCDDYISPLQYLEKHFSTPKMKGLYRFLMLDSRSSFIKQQYKGEARAYCSLVPTIMYSYKLRFGIPYEAWDMEEARYVMPHNLYEAATADIDYYTFSKDELLEIRTKGLMWQTGDKAGEVRNPLYSHKLYGLDKESEFYKVPELAQVMLTQIWCAHPENRTRYMILTPRYPCWDMVPESLIAPEIKYDDTALADSTKDTPWN